MTTVKTILALILMAGAVHAAPFRTFSVTTDVNAASVPAVTPLRWFQGESLGFTHVSSAANWTGRSNLVAVWSLQADQGLAPADSNAYLWVTGSVVAASGTVSFVAAPEETAMPVSNYWAYVTLYQTDAAGLTNEEVGVLYRGKAQVQYRATSAQYVGPWQVPSNMVDSYARSIAVAASNLAAQSSITITNGLASTSYVNQAITAGTNGFIKTETDTLATVSARGNVISGNLDMNNGGVLNLGTMSGIDGRYAFGTGVDVANISTSAASASQIGFNSGTMTIAQFARAAQQAGYNTGLMTIGASSYAAKQSLLNNGTAKVGEYAFGANQAGFNEGLFVVGDNANGAQQYGSLESGSTASNSAVGAIQVMALTTGQRAITTPDGQASILLGAGVSSNKNAIVAGDGNVSHGDASITANSFHGSGASLTGITAAQVGAVTNVIINGQAFTVSSGMATGTVATGGGATNLQGTLDLGNTATNAITVGSVAVNGEYNTLAFKLNYGASYFGFKPIDTETVGFTKTGFDIFSIGNGGITFEASRGFQWTTGNGNPYTTVDLRLTRDGPKLLRLNNGGTSDGTVTLDVSGVVQAEKIRLGPLNAFLFSNGTNLFFVNVNGVTNAITSN
jgi:hypothetical protein